MKRCGVSEAVSAVLLLAVIAAASYFALNWSAKNTIANEKSVTDAIELKGHQLQELVSVISAAASSGNTTVELLNYGTDDIVIDKVFIDGTLVSFSLYDSDGNNANTLVPREIMTLQLVGLGQSIQIITGSKNIIEVKA
jgi:hypothetical protein